jgi:ribulose kinase
MQSAGVPGKKKPKTLIKYGNAPTVLRASTKDKRRQGSRGDNMGRGLSGTFYTAFTLRMVLYEAGLAATGKGTNLINHLRIWKRNKAEV